MTRTDGHNHAAEDRINVLIDESLVCLRQNNPNDALSKIREAHSYGIKIQHLKYVEGICLQSLSRYQEARRAFEEELKSFPNNPDLRALLDELDTDSELKGGESEEDAFKNALRNAVSGTSVKKRVLNIFKKLTPDYWLKGDIIRYQEACDRNDSGWFEQVTFLNWYAHALKPVRYMEIGVRRGRSMAQVMTESPDTQAYGFDMWIPDYGSIPSQGIVAENPGPEFVKSELSRIGVKNLPVLTVGDSHVTVPAFFASLSNPGQFDLIVVDGDHTYQGAKDDLVIAFEHLAPGGALVFDDITHHDHRDLADLWHSLKADYPDFLFVEDPYGTGTGIAIKPPFDKIKEALNLQSAAVPAPDKGRIKILMVYALNSAFGRITLPEWIKESFQRYFSDQAEILAAGPGNAINVPDGPDFYQRIARVAEEQGADILLDIEGGAESMDFMFKRFPDALKIPKIFWAIDTHQYLPQLKEKAAHFDLVFSAQKNAVQALGVHARWLPAGASLHEVDFKVPRTIDIGFVGNVFPGAHDRRSRILGRVQSEFPQFKAVTGVFLEDKAKLVSQMKIVVNVSLKNDINFRVFETLACGAMLITDRIENNGLEDLFEDGKHLVTFSTEEDLIAKIRYYLTHEEERAKIAAEGQKLAQDRFMHKNVAGEILSAARDLIKQRSSDGPVVITAKAPAETTVVTFDRPGEKTACWCGGHLARSVHELYGQCESCGTMVLKRSYTKEELQKFYSKDRYWHDRQVQVFNFPSIEGRATRDFQDRIPAWHQVLWKYKPNPGKLLEIGCAHGGFLYYCKERGAKEIVGIEVDKETCEFAAKRFNIPHMVSGLFPDVELPFKKFDAITGFDVIEHFLDPVPAIKAIADHLEDDGIFFFQTPCYRGEGGEWQQFKPDEHTFLYNPESVRTLFDRCGLQVIDVLPGYFPDDMFIIGQKKKIFKRVVFIRTDSIGDNVIASGMLESIADKYNGAEIIVVCQEHIAELYENSPYISGCITFNRARAIADDNYRASVIARINALEADLCLNGVFSRDLLSDLFSLASPNAKVYAFQGDTINSSPEIQEQTNPYYSGLFENGAELCTEPERHEIFLKNLGITPKPDFSPVVWLTEDDRREARRLFELHGLDPERTIGFFPGAQFNAKVYPNFAYALSLVPELKSFSVVALGADADRNMCFDVLNCFSGKSVVLSGQLSLRVSAAALEMCRLSIGADSALAHISCAVKIPNIVLLGGGHPGRFLPYSPLTSIICLPLECYGCNFRCKFSRIHCVHDIAPETVAKAISTVLKEPVSDYSRIFIQSPEKWQSGPGLPVWESPDKWFNQEKTKIIRV